METDLNHEERGLQRTESGVLVALRTAVPAQKQDKADAAEMQSIEDSMSRPGSAEVINTRTQRGWEVRRQVRNRSEGEMSGLVRLRSFVEWQASRGRVTMHKEARDVRPGV